MMRIYSIHPCYLDTKELNGLWCEALIAQAALLSQEGYYKHSAMTRIKAHDEPNAFIGMYLKYVWEEARIVRGFNYDHQRINLLKPTNPLPVTRGQLYYEWCLLQGRLQERDPQRMALNDGVDIATIKAHPMFYIVDGDIEAWEKVSSNSYPNLISY